MPKRRYLSVDVWRPEFSKVAVSAIYEVYSYTFDCTQKDAAKIPFRKAVDALRNFENPNYKPKVIK